MSLLLPVQSSTVPENLECVINNLKWQEFVALLSVTVVDGFKWNFGNATPAAADRIWPWLRTEADGKPDGAYVYVGGFWLKKHETAPGIINIWEGTEVNIPTFDGGEAGTVTVTSGPFWERVTEMNGKIPIGVGEIHAGPPAVNIAVNENKGEYEKQLEDANYRRHRHFATARQTIGTPVGTPTSNEQIADDAGGLPSGTDYTLQGTGTAATGGRTSFVAGASQTDPNEAFPLLPQVRGIWFLRRTNRLFYRRAA